MSSCNCNIFDSSAGNTGGWSTIAALEPEKSLNIVGLETGATLAINVSNSAQLPTADPPDPSTVAFLTITGTGHPLFEQIELSAAWIQVVKTPGGGATETTVRLFGRT